MSRSAGSPDAVGPSGGSPAPHLALEALVRLRVDGEVVATWLCTPERLADLAAGWLLGEGLVHEPSELERVEVGNGDVVVGLGHEARARLEARRPAPGPAPAASEAGLLESIPSGAVRGGPEVEALLRDGDRLGALFREVYEGTPLRDAGGGVHCGGLVSGGALRDVVEDVSRHAVVDKLLGAALLEGGVPADAVLLMSGRISAPVAATAARAGAAAVASLSVPTSLAARIASRAGMTLVGRARRGTPQVLRP